MFSVDDIVKPIDSDYEVFISYRHQKTAENIAEKLYAALQQDYAVTCFRDKEELHFGDFAKQLVRYNKRSHCLVLLLTPGMLDRCKEPNDWITREVSLFLERKKLIIPIVIGDFVFPEKEDLPEKIHGLLDYKDKAINYSLSQAESSVSSIANHIHSCLRKGWSEQDKWAVINQKEEISRHNRDEEDGYFFKSATRFRRAALLFSIQLILYISVYDKFLIIGNDKWFLAVLFSILSMYIFYFDVKEFEDPNDGTDCSFIDILLDNKLIDAFRELTWPQLFWLFGFIFIYGGTMIVNIFIGAVFGNSEACFELTNHTFLILPLIRLGFNFACSALHLLNSLYSRYPGIYLKRKFLEKSERVFKIIGWVLLVPAVLALAYLSITVAGGAL